MTLYNTLRSDAQSYSLEDVNALRELFKTLSNGIKAAVQYPARHPIPLGFKDVFIEKLDRYFQRALMLTVSVAQDGIYADADIVLKCEQDQDSLPRILHRDGFRKIQILREVTPQEIDRLFAALAVCTGLDREQADAVNLFWDAQFESIRYEVADMFDDAEISLEPENERTQLTDDEKQDLNSDRERIEQERDQLEQHMVDCFGDISEFSQEHVEELQKMVDGDRELDIRGSAISLLLYIYSSVDSLQDQVASIECLKKILDKCVQQGRFATLAEILQRGKALLSDLPQSSSCRRGLSGFLLRCGDGTRLQMVTEALNKDEDSDLEPVRGFLEQLGPDSLNNLVSMLGELAHYPARRMLCDLLVSQGIDRTDILGNAVFDSRWYLVRNIVWILGEAGGEQTLTFLRRAATHPDERVRSEVVKALGKIKCDESVKMLLTMLEDKSERISSMAANELGSSGSPLAFAALQTLVTSRDFSRTSLPRIRQLLEALVICDDARALETVRGILKQSAIFGRARLRQVQEAAVNSLQHSHNPQTIEFLESLANTRKSVLSSVARKALAQMRYRMERGTDNA
jgi:hypothetical protein